MDSEEQIRKFKEFFQDHYAKQILESAKRQYLEVNFYDIAKNNPDLADDLLGNPAEVIRAAELSIKEIDDWNKSSSIVGVVRKFRCKFCNRMMPEGINPKNHQDLHKSLQKDKQNLFVYKNYSYLLL